MADRELKIKVTADTKQAEKDLKALNKFVADEEKNANQIKNAKIKQQEQQLARDKEQINNELIRKLKASDEQYLQSQKQRDNESRKYSGFTGQSTQLFSREHLSGLQSYQRSLSVLGEEHKKVAGQVATVKSVLMSNSNYLRSSQAQWMEWGENLATITGAAVIAFQQIKQYAQELFNVMLQGAKVGVMRDAFNEMAGGLENGAKYMELFQKATAQTVSEAGLLKLSNQATDLGISLDDQAILFSLAEDASDKYGITVEEAFQKIVIATEGNVRGLKALGIQKAEYNQVVAELVKQAGGEIESIQGENKEREVSIKNLGFEEQKRIRLEAIMKITGVTMESVNKKVQDNADRLQEASAKWDDFKNKLGEALSDVFLEKMDGLTKKTGELKIGFDELVGAVKGWVNFVIDYVPNIYMVFQKVLNFVNNIKETWGWITGNVNKSNMPTVKVDPSKVLGNLPLDPLFNMYKTYDKVIEKEQELTKSKTAGTGRGSNARSESIEKEKTALEKLIIEYDNLATKQGELLSLDFYNYLNKLNVILNQETADSEEWYKILKKINDVKKSIEDIDDKTISEGLKLLSEQVKETKKLFKLQEEYTQIKGKRFREQQVQNTQIELEKQQKQAERIQDVYESSLNLVQSITDVLGLGADNFISKMLNGFNQIMSLANSLVNFLAMFMNMGSGGIFGFIGTLLGIGGGGAAVGGGRASGGAVSGGTPYLVGEQGMEMFIPQQSGSIISNARLMNLINTPSFSSSNNIYLGMNVDKKLGFTIIKENMDAYMSYRIKKQIG